MAKKYVETYSSSNAAALYPEERVTKINLVTLLITQKIQWKQWYFTESCKRITLNKKKKRNWSNLRLTDVEWPNFPVKRFNNPKLPCCHANLFNVPSEYQFLTNSFPCHLNVRNYIFRTCPRRGLAVREHDKRSYLNRKCRTLEYSLNARLFTLTGFDELVETR